MNSRQCQQTLTHLQTWATVPYSDPKVTYTDPKVTYGGPNATHMNVTWPLIHTSPYLHLPYRRLKAGRV